jgi:hypothetical protein
MKVSFSTALACIAGIISFSEASPFPLNPRHQSPKLTNVFQFSQVGTWLENLAIRSSGTILATRVDVPELWSIDPVSGTGALAATIPGNATNTLLGITEIAHDVFAVVAGQINLKTVTPTAGSWAIWKVDYSKGAATPDVSIIKAIPEGLFLNGITTFCDDSILIADCGQGVIYRLNWKTGSYAIALSDDSMKPATGTPIGVNGVKTRDNYVYYTSSTQKKFMRVPVDKSAKATGPYEVIATGFFQDDFVLAPWDDGKPYIATNYEDTVVTLDEKGDVHVVAGSNTSLAVAGSTAVQVGRMKGEERTLYVTTSGGLAAPVNGTVVEPAKLVKIQLGD